MRKASRLSPLSLPISTQPALLTPVLFTTALVTLALVALVASGCRSVPTTHFYTLHAPTAVAADIPTTEAAAPSDGLYVEVASFLVDPPYDRAQLVYRIGADAPEVGFYNYHQWAAPLSRMLPVLVAEELRGTPGFASIRPASSIAISPNEQSRRARLDGRLVYLEEVDTTAGVSTRVRLDLLLTRADGERLWEGTVVGESHGSVGSRESQSVAEVVEQMRDAVRQALAQARAELAGFSG